MGRGRGLTELLDMLGGTCDWCTAASGVMVPSHAGMVKGKGMHGLGLSCVDLAEMRMVL
jgi:hypothetical protein